MECTKSEFVQHVLSAQMGLRLFLHSVVMDPEVADELLQRTNLILCEKAEEFIPGTNFAAWARRIAHYELLAYRRKQVRERQRLVFDDDQLDHIASLVDESWTLELTDERRALRDCVARLPQRNRDLLRRRYEMGEDVIAIAEHLERPAGSIRQTLFRIRLSLLSCIQSTLGSGGRHE